MSRPSVSLRQDTSGAAGVFSVLTLLALTLCIGYTCGMADATLHKMKVQDAADAVAYSGARVRGNLYQVYGMLNMAKIALYRRSIGYPISDGQNAVLMEMGRIAGISVDPGLLSDSVIDVGETVGEKCYRYAKLADDMQEYMAENFGGIIESEMRYIAEQHEVELLACTPGGAPEFGEEWQHGRYWGHFLELERWIGFEQWACDITRAVRDSEIIPTPPPSDWWERLPPYPYLPKVIVHSLTHDRNSIKAVVSMATHPSVVLPGVLQTFHTDVVATAAGACFSPTLEAATNGANLYTTDFRGELLSVESAKLQTWLETEEPSLAQEIPWVPELTVH